MREILSKLIILNIEYLLPDIPEVIPFMQSIHNRILNGTPLQNFSQEILKCLDMYELYLELNN